MKALSGLLTSALLLAGCSQVIDQFYAKANFDAQSFNADLSRCKQRSVSMMHVDAVQPKTQVDDPAVSECMKAKGYTVELETK